MNDVFISYAYIDDQPFLRSFGPRFYLRGGGALSLR